MGRNKFIIGSKGVSESAETKISRLINSDYDEEWEVTIDEDYVCSIDTKLGDLQIREDKFYFGGMIVANEDLIRLYNIIINKIGEIRTIINIERNFKKK